MQIAKPSTSEILPFVHGRQAEIEFAADVFEAVPIGHFWQTVELVAPTTTEYVPGAHEAHDEAPSILL